MNFAVGNTSLRRLESFAGVQAKLEMENPTGSAKDRAALYMLRDAVSRGVLAPGGTVIEPTSGNTGIALAAIARQEGYQALIVMPDSMSPERRSLMQAFGARVVLTPGDLGIAGAIAEARRLQQQIPGSFLAGQFENTANALAHYCTTGPVIWAQSGGKADIFVCAVGTGGTITGTGRYLKEQNPALRILAVEPAESPVLSGGRAGPHEIQGIGAGFVPEVLDVTLLDGVIAVTGHQAAAAARRLWQQEGILGGISSGAALVAAEQLALQHPEAAVITVLPDTGERYLSMGLFD